MTNLKCFGGPNDGDVVRFDHGQREVGLIKQEPASVRATYRHFGLGEATVMQKRTIYTCRSVSFASGQKVQFLAPDFMTDEEALREALEP